MASNPTRVGAVASLALVAALFGCGGGERAGAVAAPAPASFAEPAAAPPAAPETTGRPTERAAAKPVEITIKDFVFKPEKVRVKPGQSIKVTNLDRVVHTITADDKTFDSGDLKKGQSYTFSVGKAGTYGYFCDPHQYMRGSIVVK